MEKDGHKSQRLLDADLNPKLKTDTIPLPADLQKIMEITTLKSL